MRFLEEMGATGSGKNEGFPQMRTKKEALPSINHRALIEKRSNNTVAGKSRTLRVDKGVEK